MTLESKCLGLSLETPGRITDYNATTPDIRTHSCLSVGVTTVAKEAHLNDKALARTRAWPRKPLRRFSVENRCPGGEECA